MHNYIVNYTGLVIYGVLTTGQMFQGIVIKANSEYVELRDNDRNRFAIATSAVVYAGQGSLPNA